MQPPNRQTGPKFLLFSHTHTTQPVHLSCLFQETCLTSSRTEDHRGDARIGLRPAPRWRPPGPRRGSAAAAARGRRRAPQRAAAPEAAAGSRQAAARRLEAAAAADGLELPVAAGGTRAAHRSRLPQAGRSARDRAIHARRARPHLALRPGGPAAGRTGGGGRRPARGGPRGLRPLHRPLRHLRRAALRHQARVRGADRRIAPRGGGAGQLAARRAHREPRGHRRKLARGARGGAGAAREQRKAAQGAPEVGRQGDQGGWRRLGASLGGGLAPRAAARRLGAAEPGAGGAARRGRRPRSG